MLKTTKTGKMVEVEDIQYYHACDMCEKPIGKGEFPKKDWICFDGKEYCFDCIITAVKGKIKYYEEINKFDK